MNVTECQRLVIAACLVASVAGCAVQSPEGATAREPDVSAEDSGSSARPVPVVTTPESWRFYPQANIEGDVKLAGGCLLIGSYVAIWPSGTEWDEATQAVTFEAAVVPPPEVGEDTHPPARVDEHFQGAGGFLSQEELRRLLGTEAVKPIEACLAQTRATGVVFAYPSD